MTKSTFWQGQANDDAEKALQAFLWALDMRV